MVASNLSAEINDGLPTVWFPEDYGLISWTHDPVYDSTTYTLATAGVVYAVGLKVPSALVTNVVVDMTTAGGTLTTSQCFAGLYQGGSLLGSSADQSTAWAGSTGLLTIALATPVEVQQGLVYAAFVFNGTTGPTFAASTGTYANLNLSAANSRYATFGTSQHTLPASTSTFTASAHAPWVALS